MQTHYGICVLKLEAPRLFLKLYQTTVEFVCLNRELQYFSSSFLNSCRHTVWFLCLNPKLQCVCSTGRWPIGRITKWSQEAPRRLILSMFGPWPPNGPRRLPEGPFWAFSGFGHQMAPGSSQKAHFEHFQALATKWPQEAPRRPILSVFGLWPIWTYLSLFGSIWAHLGLSKAIWAYLGLKCAWSPRKLTPLKRHLQCFFSGSLCLNSKLHTFVWFLSEATGKSTL